jgi:hypothetical protein
LHLLRRTQAATTVEHMPPRIMFTGKLRPAQLEFPCCDPCNQATKHSDLLAAFLGRLLPDAETNLKQEDVKKILRGLAI